MRKRNGRARLARNPEIEARAKLLGPALRVLRQRKQRTQIALCKEIEVTKGMLSGYETGRQHLGLHFPLAHRAIEISRSLTEGRTRMG